MRASTADNLCNTSCAPDPQDAVAGGREHAVTPPVGSGAADVPRAVDFNDEFCFRSVKVRDEPLQHHLAPEAHSQLAPAERLPKNRLRSLWSETHPACTLT